MITFQGDLNFDGRVSMKDLAFLNAGKLNAIQNGNQAPDDVDANYDGQITATDLAILDRDWEEQYTLMLLQILLLLIRNGSQKVDIPNIYGWRCNQ